MATGAAPFDALQVADLGDVAINTYSIEKSMAIISSFYDDVLAAGCRPLDDGRRPHDRAADPALARQGPRPGRAGARRRHADVNDEMFGEPIAHGTPFRRAVEEGLLSCDKVFQIGLRGTGYAADDFDWPRRRGFTLVPRTRSGTSRWRR